MQLKILHFADLHLETSFGALGALGVSVWSPRKTFGELRREELRETLRRILEKGKELEVNAITIGGDLYEHEKVTQDTLNFLLTQFKNCPFKIFISPGNHDPFVSDSLYRRGVWSENVFIFSSPSLECQPLTPGIYLWGAALNSFDFPQNLLKGFKVPEEGVHILLLHATDITRIPPGKKVCCPFTPEDLKESGFSLALLGHFHSLSLFPASSHPLYCYPGSPEPLGFDEENGDKHCILLVEIQNGEISVQPISISSIDYKKVRIDVSDALSFEDIKQKIKALESSHGKSFVRVILEGFLNPDVDLNIERLLKACHESFAFLDIEDRTSPAYDLEALKEEMTVRGAFVRKICSLKEQIKSEKERTLYDKALIYGLKALEGKELTL